MCAVENGSVKAKSISDSHKQNGDEIVNNSLENPEALDDRSSRYRRVLFFVACRVLGNREEAEEAVCNCLLSASYGRPRFECEGAFRSWWVRIVIDEALQILQIA
jgi:DNA-directed RNA polymerase specialized sigma24 family protein